jgi:NADPH-dependent curcumin reductase CurA
VKIREEQGGVMSEIKSREVRLKNRPVGLPSDEDFELVETTVPEPGPGEVLVRNVYMSVDPYMRGRMREHPLGEPLLGGCVGYVERSRANGFQVGDTVLGGKGWRERYVSDASGLDKVAPDLGPLQTYLGALGMPGRTAYVGLLDIGQPQAGETVFVSAASGAVGAVVCQIAKIKGCRVVGSAGSEAKVAWLVEEAGIDAAIYYKGVDDLSAALGEACPDGVDVYFENVGGEHLEAALDHMNMFGRIPLCGMISQYNATEPPPGPSNLGVAVGKRLTLKGFIVGDHAARFPQFYADMGRWIAEGKIKWRETVVEGLEKAPAAFIGLFKGENFGKMLVKIGPEPPA